MLVCLVILSFSFYVTAQENSDSQNIFLDSDQDGLTDEEEKMYGTDPKNRDTDADSYSDGAEVKAGYDPKIPAPGDRLADFKNQENNSSDEAGTAPAGENLTAAISQKIADLPTDTEISIDDIQTMIDESLTQHDISEEIPEVSIDDIKIKEQNYGKYSDEEAKKRKKEDFADYISAIFYIFASNSPEPITSATDASSAMINTFQNILFAISLRNSESLEDISRSGERILEQLNEVEVPEDLVDFHIKALQYAMYAQGLKSSIKSDPTDPLSDIANLSKIQAFIQSVLSFSGDVEAKLDEYDVTYSDIQEKSKDFGFELPNLDIIDSALDAVENKE